MDNHIKQIAARLRGLREVLELTEQELADSCQMSVEEYKIMEWGTGYLGKCFADYCPPI